MGTQNTPFDEINFDDLSQITQDLQSVDKRDSNIYKDKIDSISDRLNRLDRGVITRIDIDELREQIGHLLYYDVKNVLRPVPFDLEYLPSVHCHFKNPTVMILRRIRKYLMSSHRKTLAKLEEEQARERQIDLDSLDLNALIKNDLEEMQRFQTMASLSQSITRKLDILTRALHVPARANTDFRLLERFFADRHHLRHREAMGWINASMFQGNRGVLHKFVEKGRALIKQKSDGIFDEMQRISGIPFDRVTDGLEAGFSWFSLGTPLRRGEDFVRIFENEENIENQIKRLTYFMVRGAWDAKHYRNQIDENFPSVRERQENCTQLCRLYFELEHRIKESTKPEGDVQIAIATDVANGLLDEGEAETARNWVVSNKAQLNELKLEIFATLGEQKALHPEVALPEIIEELLEHEGQGSVETGRGGLPKVTIMDLHKQVGAVEDRLALPDGEVLAELVRLRTEVSARKAKINHVDFQRQIRDGCRDFSEYEERLQEYEKVEDRLEEMSLNLEKWILSVYREVSYSEVDGEVLDQAFELVIDHMLRAIRTLDYEVIDAKRFRDLFDKALILDDGDALIQMDRLLHEVHSIPRQNQILPALADWESTLGKKKYEAKQEQIMENEIALQKLVDEVRNELRERIGRTDIRPRRLRFEVFSLADCYAGNLRTLLEGLLRLAPCVASDVEGERLTANISAIEGQIIEAQRITKSGGDAYDRLAELQGMNLLPDQVSKDLSTDLAENFEDLDALLQEASEGLERVRLLQNRFGGGHDTSHLAVIINIHDLESLKRIYHFVDNITITDVKRFGIIYKQKNSVMEDLYDRAYEDDDSVPPTIAKLINAKVYKQFKQSNVVPLPLKTAILRDIPEILEFECELLIRTLNLVSEIKVREKAIYIAILGLLAQAKSSTMDKKRSLRRIWIKFRKRINNYKPRNFQQNYHNNTRALLTDANEIIGASFDGL